MNRAARRRICFYLLIAFGLTLICLGINIATVDLRQPRYEPIVIHPTAPRIPPGPPVLTQGMDEGDFHRGAPVDHGQPRSRDVIHDDPREGEGRERHYYRGMEVIRGPKSIGGDE